MTAALPHTDLDVASLPYLADHVVQGVRVLPGSVYVELARAAARDGGLGHPRVLREVRFLRAFVVPEARPKRLEVTVAPAGPAGWDLTVMGVDTGIRHATARLPAAVVPRPAGIDPADPAWQHGRILPGEQLYTALSAAGNEFGPAFRGVLECRVQDGSAVGRLRPAAAGHPLGSAPLDAAMQVLVAATGEAGHLGLVLSGVDEIVWHDRPAVRVYARLRDGWRHSAEPVGDAVVVDKTGQTSVELTGVRLRRLQAPGAGTARARIAVTATFSAEPLADSLAFWLDTAGVPATVEFAPYRQVYQQLLDPGSLVSRADGAAVVLVRPQDLTGSVSAAPAARPLSGDGPRFRVPGLGDIAHLAGYETAYLYDEIFVRRAYLRHGIELPGDAVVVDVGANIGLFTLFVRQGCPGARVYAFEPAPEAAAALRRNVAAYCPDTRVFEVGLAEAEDERLFTSYRRSSAFSGFAADDVRDRASIEAVARNVLRAEGGARPQDVEDLLGHLVRDRLDARTYQRRTTTLSRVFTAEGLRRVDLLKIDAEGYEERVLRGIADEDWPAIRQVVVEAHDPSRARRVRETLERRGFTVVVDDDDELLRGTGFALVSARRPGSPARHADGPAASGELERNTEDLLRAVRHAAEAATVPLIVVLCPPSAADRQLDRAQARLADGLGAVAGVQVITPRDIQRAYPVPDYDDPRAEELGRIPYTDRFFAAAGTLIARRIVASRRPPAKVLALDCDETLWAGRCGEAGPLGVRIGEANRAVQEYAVRQHATGTLVCLCSRNNAADVMAVFAERDDLVLNLGHLAGTRLNWAPKSENLASLAAELGVGLDSVVFLDDDPVECAEVRAHRPEALTLCLPDDPAQVPALLTHLWAFDRTGATAEDTQRTRWYGLERRRDEARQSAVDFASFIAGLELRAGIDRWAPDDLDRVAQLTQRVNQFTTTGVRRSAAELRTALAGGGLDCHVVRVSDRFGDYGLVGAVLTALRAEALRVESFLLSCRALGRGVEHRMLATLGELAVRRSVSAIEMPLVDTGQNAPARAFLEAVMGASRPDGDGVLFSVPASTAARTVFRPGAGEPVAARPGRRAPAREAAVPYRRIAEELHDLDAVMAAITRHRVRRRPLGTPPAAPDDDLERALVRTWREVLAVDEVGVDDNFFELGGTSLRAVRLTAELSERFGRSVASTDLFEHPSVRAMAALLRNDGRESAGTAGQRRGERRRARRRGPGGGRGG
jgi:FkbH-like protein/FkbM family methyltransferase